MSVARVARLSQQFHTWRKKPYVCSRGNKAFTDLSSSSLRQHGLTHTGSKAYVCSTCNKAFFQASNLKTHMLTHTKDKPYVCYVCNKGSSHGSSLQQHTKVHTGKRPGLMYVEISHPHNTWARTAWNRHEKKKYLLFCGNISCVYATANDSWKNHHLHVSSSGWGLTAKILHKFLFCSVHSWSFLHNRMLSQSIHVW